jgi:hypothetical protein
LQWWAGKVEAGIRVGVLGSGAACVTCV